jgi:hypothetical protein
MRYLLALKQAVGMITLIMSMQLARKVTLLITLMHFLKSN